MSINVNKSSFLHNNLSEYILQGIRNILPFRVDDFEKDLDILATFLSHLVIW